MVKQEDSELDYIPTTEATIAARRSHRLLRRIESADGGLFTADAWWRSGYVELAALTLISVLNLFLLSPLVGTASPSNTYSGPLIPFLASIVATISRIPFSYAAQMVNVFFFLLLPVSLYILIKLLTNRILTALFAVLIATLPLTLFLQGRVEAGLLGGDSSHVASLGLMPLALFCLIAFLRRGGMKNLVIASALSAAIILISPSGAISYFLLAIFATFSEALLGGSRIKILRFASLFLLVGALTSFWYNPSFTFWLIFGPLGDGLRTGIVDLIPLSLFIIPVLGTFGFLLFDRKPNLQAVFLASFWTIGFLIIDCISSGGFPPSGTSRYLPELGLTLAFLLGLGITYFIDSMKQSKITRIPQLNRPAFSNPLITLVLGLLVAGSIILRKDISSGLYSSNKLLDNVDKSTLWVLRDNFTGTSALVGYTITGVTLLVICWAYIKRRVWIPEQEQ